MTRNCAFGAGRFMAALALSVCASVVALMPAAQAAPDNVRTISFYNFHTKERTTVTYKRNGKYIPAGMKKVNWAMRDWRRNEATKMDPKLVDLLWEIHHELGSKKPIWLISGYRSLKTNNMLRRSRGGQARRSRHIIGSAADVHFPDIPVRTLRYSALIRQQGGVGYYPNSSIPFVHIDTGRVRHWPRMGRDELALLFKGRSRHASSSGRVRPKHYRNALRRRRALADRIAAFYKGRETRKQVRLAALRKPSRQQVAARIARPQPPAQRPVIPWEPQLIDRPAAIARPDLGTRPSQAERGRLAAMAALALRPDPKLVQLPTPVPPPRPMVASLGGGVVPWNRLRRPDETTRGPLNNARRPAPVTAALPPEADATTTWVSPTTFDDEHPEELAYRPFAIAPMLTRTPSTDDPALVKLRHPDVRATLRMLGDESGAGIQMRFRPGPQHARLANAQRFAGAAIDLSALSPRPPDAKGRLNRRRVRVAPR
ncbi:MAG: DUF882 domain-containing protein [Pseudomonadota bacterium]